jgi:hypothetical protein
MRNLLLLLILSTAINCSKYDRLIDKSDLKLSKLICDGINQVRDVERVAVMLFDNAIEDFAINSVIKCASIELSVSVIDVRAKVRNCE